MKSLVFASLVITGSVAFADVGDQTPTGDLVSFDSVASVSVCTYNLKDELQRCAHKQEDTRVRDTSSSELIHTEGIPAGTFNDSAEVEKTYLAIRPDTGQRISVTMNLYFLRTSDFDDQKVPIYDIALKVTYPESGPEDQRENNLMLSELNGVKGFVVEGRHFIERKGDGTYTEIIPRITVLNFKITKK